MDLERLTVICTSFPGVEQDIKWEHDLCFLVGKKMFAATGLHRDFNVSFKVTPEKFAELVERPGIIPAPYLGRYHWVSVSDGQSLTIAEWEALLKASYQAVFDKLPRKVRLSLQGDP